jgi:hypothetical protein
MYKINAVSFTILFFLFFNYSKAQIKNTAMNSEIGSLDKESIFSNTTKCFTLPFGYSDISQRTTIAAILPTLQDENKLKEINALKFDSVIKKELLLFQEEYDVFLQFNSDVNEKYDSIKISTNFLCYGACRLYFIAVYNNVRYARPFIEKMYLFTTKNSKPVDMKRIYLYHEGEMGFANYTLFNIDKNYVISLQDYEFTDFPFLLTPLRKYQILPSGKFCRYYDNSGLHNNNDEQGLVKNHHKEGRWLEFKSNGYIDLQQYPEFTDSYTYLEAEYKNGLPVGEWKFYKLLQQYNEETGEPIVNTRKKGKLIYTEVYREGMLEKREYKP